jgi:phosphatidate cytidylyltransferase
VPLPVLLPGGQLMIWLAWPFGVPGVAGGFGLTLVAALLWRLRSGASHYVRDVTATVFAAAYVPLCCAFAALMTVTEPDGLGRVLTFMIPVVASDIGGYAAGVIAGRHPMAPTISPKKSWEGFAGRRSPAWRPARSASCSCSAGSGGRARSSARCSSAPRCSATSSSP